MQGKQDTLSAGTGIDITNNVISVTGGGGGSSYTAGYGIDIDTANTISVTGQVASSAITTAVTTASTDSEIPTAKAVNDAIAAGGGGGGGTTYSAGTNISISNDTINCTIPISAGSATYSVVLGQNSPSKATGGKSIVGGQSSQATAEGAVALGQMCKAQTNWSFVNGNMCKTYSTYTVGDTNGAVACGNYIETYGHGAGFGTYNNALDNGSASGLTLFSVGNGTSNARHNAFEIRENGDIYISNTNDTGTTQDTHPMIKLQDNLGGGGTVDQTVISGSTNAVAGGAVYDQMGGMKIVKLTESEYTALVTKDADTLYVVIPDPSN